MASRLLGHPVLGSFGVSLNKIERLVCLKYEFALNTGKSQVPIFNGFSSPTEFVYQTNTTPAISSHHGGPVYEYVCIFIFHGRGIEL